MTLELACESLLKYYNQRVRELDVNLCMQNTYFTS